MNIKTKTRSEKIAIRVAKKYSIADEIALSRKLDVDIKKIAYLEYVTECKACFTK